MKKSLFFLPLALGLVACSEKDVVDMNGNNGNKDVDVSYLAVNIVSSQTAGSRADNDYSVGSEAENKVNAIRFYFFDKDGNAAAVKANGATFYDAKSEEISNDFDGDSTGENQNLESTVSAVIVIESPKEDKKPYYIAAVINPTATTPVLEAGKGTINDLKDWKEDYTDHQKSDFVMSSTTYKNAKPSYVDDVLQKGDDDEYTLVPVFDKIKPTRLQALDEKATIHVERVLAKLSVEVGIQDKIEIDGEDAYRVGHVGMASAEVADTDKDAIFVKFLGWNTTATRKESRLVKRLSNDDATCAAWDDPFEGWVFSWNHKDNHRSFWAVNPENSTNWWEDYNYGDFGEYTTDFPKQKGSVEKYNANYFKFDGDTDYTYLQENAGSFADPTRLNDETSKIIVAAQLIDKDGNPLDIVEWGGDIYRKDKNLLQKIAETMDLWIVDATKGSADEPETGRYTQLTGGDIELVHVPSEPTSSTETKQRYYMTIKLIHDPQKPEPTYAYRKYVEGKGWVFDEGQYNPTPGAKLTTGGYEYKYTEGDTKYECNDVYPFNTSIEGLGYIKYWHNGYTYYWVDIKHFGSMLGDEPGIGYYGVVRNHWYKYKFTSVKGLGVPVPDPSEVIYPETPDDEQLYYLAAELEILSWKLVLHQDEQLGWE